MGFIDLATADLELAAQACDWIYRPLHARVTDSSAESTNPSTFGSCGQVFESLFRVGSKLAALNFCQFHQEFLVISWLYSSQNIRDYLGLVEALFLIKFLRLFFLPERKVLQYQVL